MIRKGEEWGRPYTPTGREPVAVDDVSLARLLADDAPPPVVVLLGGDLHRSLGGRASQDPVAMPIDVVRVTADGAVRHAVAHVVARRSGWRGRCWVGMNATHLGSWNLGPKAHPNDGLVDVTEGALPWRDRLAARRRAPSGTHVPHPALATRRVRRDRWEFDRPIVVRLDGVVWRRARVVEIEVLADRSSVVLA